MALTNITSDDRQDQQTSANHLREAHDCKSVSTYKTQTLGANGTLGLSV